MLIISVKFWVPISNVWIKLAGRAELLRVLWVSSQRSAVLCSGSSGQHSCAGGSMFCPQPLLQQHLFFFWDFLEQKNPSAPLLGFWGDATCSSQVCLGEVTISCGGEAPALGSLCLKRWLAQSYWEVAATLVTTSLTKLFFSPCLSFCTTIKPLWYQSSPVQVFLFSPFYCKKHQALATRDSLVLPCCCMWIRVFVIDVFQQFFDNIFYCSLVNNADRHYMSEIILQFKLHKFMASK